MWFVDDSFSQFNNMCQETHGFSLAAIEILHDAELYWERPFLMDWKIFPAVVIEMAVITLYSIWAFPWNSQYNAYMTIH